MHEIPKISVIIRGKSIKEYHEYQKKRWACPRCGEMVRFYKYEYSECGKKILEE